MSAGNWQAACVAEASATSVGFVNSQLFKLHPVYLYVVPCRRVVEVEQVGESKILMFHTTFSTEVRVLEDDSDPSRLKTEFELIRSVRITTRCIWVC